MTHQPPHELFTSGRPVRSDYARERSYARRRIITVTILSLVIGGSVYILWGRSAPNSNFVPTIKAEQGAFREKPADPGGIQIPNQNVMVYDQLDGKNAAPAQAEHMLPPPEKPEAAAPAAPSAAPAEPPKQDILTETPPRKIETTVTAPPAISTPAPKISQPAASAPAPVKATPVPVAATPVSVAAAPVPRAVPTPAAPPVAAPAAEPAPAPAPPATIAQVIARTKPPASSGKSVVQLASSADQAAAQAMMKKMQEQYASVLGDATLQLQRADLGARGIFYRIQTQGLEESDASRICTALKQMKAGCILVKK